MIPRLNSHQARFRVLPLVFFLFALLPCLHGTAGAQTPRTPQEMLDNAEENLRIRLNEVRSAPLNEAEALEILRELIDGRRLSQRVVALDFALDDFMGLVMMDRYDEAYIAVIDSLILHYVAGDVAPPDPAAASIFAQRLGTLPPVGDTPTAFIVAILISRAWNAASSMSATDPMKPAVSKVALRAIGQATTNYLNTRKGESLQKSDDFWHASVIQRMLCPEHRCPYTMNEVRNGLKPDGALFRRYVVQCREGEETRNVDFDLGVLSEMTRSGGYQELKVPIHSPAEKLPSVEP